MSFSTKKLVPFIYAIPLLMCLIALNQIRMAKRQHLDPWKGGGFGMFASNVSTGSRVLVCIGIDKNGQEVRLLPEFQKLDTEKWSKDFEVELKANPTLEKLEKIANALLKKNYLKKLDTEKWSKDFEVELKANPTLEKLEKIANALLKKNYLKKLNQEKQTSAEMLGWDIREAIYIPLREDNLKLDNDVMYSFSTVKTAIYEIRYNSNENTVKFFELIKYHAMK